MTRFVAALSLAFLALACAVAEDGNGATTFNTSYMDEDPPNGCDTDDCPLEPDADWCKDASDCAAGQACVAPFTGDKRGPYRCTDACLSDMAEAWWCSDDLACCNPDAVCSSRGYCEPPPPAGTSGGGSSSGGSSGGGSSGSTGG